MTASVKVFETKEQVALKGECQHAVSHGLIRPDDNEIEVQQGLPGRMSPDEITMFDATGMALQDLHRCKDRLKGQRSEYRHGRRDEQ